MNPVDVFGYVLLAGLLLVSAVAVSVAQGNLDNPEDTKTVYLIQLKDLSLLQGAGTWEIRIDRQSGHVHSHRLYEGDAAGALEQAMTTFRRAGINEIRIRRNEPACLEFNRLIYSHRGRAEGKKVCAATVTRLDK